MRKTVLQNEQYLNSLQERGELAIQSKNDIGVNTFSGSSDKDGLISGRLYVPRYNQEELLKSINVNITELLPQSGPSVGSFVTRSLYEEERRINEERLLEIETLNTEVRNLQSTVQTLETTTESLNREIDNLRLFNVTVDNQLQSTQEDFSNQSSDLSNAIQNSIKEATQRISLTARNESLQQEIDLLREQLFGKQAQLEAGATSSGTLFTVNTSPIVDDSQPAIRGSKRLTTIGQNKTYDTLWVNGEKLTILNPTDGVVNISFKRMGSNGAWIFTPQPFSLTAGEKRTITLRIDQSQYKSTNKKSANKNYDDTLQVIGRDESGVEETVELKTRLRKWRERG